jgi:nucleoid-associated protein YgaU
MEDANESAEKAYREKIRALDNEYNKKISFQQEELSTAILENANQVQKIAEEKEEAEHTDTASVVVSSDTFRLPAKDKNKAVLPIVLSDAVRYDIQGTLATHTLRRGESLARLAERYYGNRNLWTYLARYNRNRIKDANDIPIGTLICIPKLVPKE